MSMIRRQTRNCQWVLFSHKSLKCVLFPGNILKNFNQKISPRKQTVKKSSCVDYEGFPSTTELLPGFLSLPNMDTLIYSMHVCFLF